MRHGITSGVSQKDVYTKNGIGGEVRHGATSVVSYETSKTWNVTPHLHREYQDCSRPNFHRRPSLPIGSHSSQMRSASSHIPNIHMYMYIEMYTSLSLCTYIYIYIHICIHVYVCVYTYIYIYIYIERDTHTYPGSSNGEIAVRRGGA